MNLFPVTINLSLKILFSCQIFLMIATMIIAHQIKHEKYRDTCLDHNEPLLKTEFLMCIRIECGYDNMFEFTLSFCSLSLYKAELSFLVSSHQHFH
jgi:hypothetical protein